METTQQLWAYHSRFRFLLPCGYSYLSMIVKAANGSTYGAEDEADEGMRGWEIGLESCEGLRSTDRGSGCWRPGGGRLQDF